MATYKTPSGVEITTDASGNITGDSSGNAGGSASSASTSSSDPFIQTLQQKLLDSSGIVSSFDSKIEGKINEAIQGVQAGNEASKAGIESAYGRSIADVKTAGAQKYTSAQEAQRGFAVNTAALKQIQDYTDKSVKDLQQRKEEALMAGDAATASKVADLQLKGLEFEQQAVQQTFSNLLSISNFAISGKQLENQTRAQNFAEKQAIDTVALQYGLTVQPGDTIDSITSRAAPLASEAQRLQLDKVRQEIAQSKAETAKALSDAAANAPLSAVQIKAIAQAALQNPAVLSTIKNTGSVASVINEMTQQQKVQFKTDFTTKKSQGVTKDEAIKSVTTDQSLTPQAMKDALDAIDLVYGGGTSKDLQPVTLPSLYGSYAQGTKNVLSSLFESMTGVKLPAQ